MYKQPALDHPLLKNHTLQVPTGQHHLSFIAVSIYKYRLQSTNTNIFVGKSRDQDNLQLTAGGWHFCRIDNLHFIAS